MKRHSAIAATCLALSGWMATAPAPAADDLARDLAASCAACHGTDGRATGRMPVLAGRDRAELLEQLRAFRDGTRESTVMHQHAKGYTDDELARLAAYFASVRGDGR